MLIPYTGEFSCHLRPNLLAQLVFGFSIFGDFLQSNFRSILEPEPAAALLGPGGLSLFFVLVVTSMNNCHSFSAVMAHNITAKLL